MENGTRHKAVSYRYFFSPKMTLDSRRSPSSETQGWFIGREKIQGQQWTIPGGKKETSRSLYQTELKDYFNLKVTRASCENT